MTSRPMTAAPILAVLAIVLALLGAYMGIYLSLLRDWRLGSLMLESGVHEEIIWRVCEHNWQTQVFAPAARLESLIRCQHVELFCWEEILKSDDALTFSIDAP